MKGARLRGARVGRLGPRSLVLSLVLAWLVCAAGSAETTTGGNAEPVLVPQTVYVGDRARLIVPVDASAAGLASPTVIEVAERLPRSKDAVVLRVELQRAEGGWRALVDFTAYAPGAVELPRIEAGVVVLSGLVVSIASILETEGGTAELSPPAKPLAAPGTALLLYASTFTLVAAALLGAFLFVRGPALVRDALERRRRGLVARSMRRVAARLADNLATMNPADFLAILFSELRSYLSYRTGVNCLALTPREFPEALDRGPRLPSSRNNVYVMVESKDGAFLEKLFRWGDAVRFGGETTSRAELDAALEEVVALVEKVEVALEANAARRRAGPGTRNAASDATGAGAAT